MRPLLHRWIWTIVAAWTFGVSSLNVAHAQDEFELAPIGYSAATPDNSISRLQAAIDRGETKLAADPKFGYLPSLLEALQIPHESQMLVFSKTSLQRGRIAPRTPRAIYFNDDVYVGYCHAGEMLELSVADPQLGAVYYTLVQEATDEKPQLVRQTEKCLQCHGTSQTDNIPGHFVRSVFIDAGGLPLLSEGSRRVDHTTPIADRWGGWYVTGSHGELTHLGNLIVRGRQLARPVDNAAGLNVVSLADRLPTDNYLTPHSDIVALMVFEHQTLVHNLLTKANFATRQALHYETEFNRSLGEPTTNKLESTQRRINNACEHLVEGLLFAGEAPITAPIAGSTKFAEQFAARGPRDSCGRSLRDFDLQSRMFKHPCSYLIHSPSFDGLPGEVKTRVGQRLHEILSGQDTSKTYGRLTADNRRAIAEILRETKPGLLP